MKTTTRPDLYGFIDQALAKKIERYKVPFSADFAGGVAEALGPLWRVLGQLEYDFLEDRLQDVNIKNPVYVCGLARSGTTILLQALFSSGCFASHRYSDYPFIDFPVIWRSWLGFMPQKDEMQQERAHMDRLEITSESPEALEEMIWMSFFKGAHDPSQNNCLDGTTQHGDFETYYKKHIRKILYLGKKNRYLAKGNYNLVRIAYLHKLFPDSRFIIAIRKPEDHIASLMKQHYLFSCLEKEDSKILRYMSRMGHFEFGLNRAPINVGDEKLVKDIQDAWEQGQEVKGWALYWNMIYRYVYDNILMAPSLKDTVKLVRYEDFCSMPDTVLGQLTSFCALDHEPSGQEITAPSYYHSGFSEKQRALIDEITGETVHLYYGTD